VCVLFPLRTCLPRAPTSAAGTPPVSTRIPVVEGQKLRTGVPVVAGYIKASQLIPDNYAIPTYDPRTDKGYQRPLQDSRVNELVSDLKMERILMAHRYAVASTACRGFVRLQ
jgi:hypothetical protein